ncbi:MAG TPA: polysaccharide lyase [Solirubrobacteraceae bacterium]|nr:polysaccharide lyase [Solirubrobacteraceae bacterium]
MSGAPAIAATLTAALSVGAGASATATQRPPAARASALAIECRSAFTARLHRRPRCLPAERMSLLADGLVHLPSWTGRMASSRLAGWTQRQALGGGIRVVRGPRTGRRHVTLFTVRPGDVPVGAGGERAEVAASAQATAGVDGGESWYVWSTYFPSDLNPAPATTFNVFTQFHQLHATKDSCPPNVAFQVNTKTAPALIRLAVRGGSLNRTACVSQTIWSKDTVALALGRWYDFAFHVRWSPDASVGFVELAIDGTVVVPRTAMATLYRGQTVYAKQGFYRAPSSLTSRIYQAGMTRF